MLGMAPCSKQREISYLQVLLSKFFTQKQLTYYVLVSTMCQIRGIQRFLERCHPALKMLFPVTMRLSTSILELALLLDTLDFPAHLKTDITNEMQASVPSLGESFKRKYRVCLTIYSLACNWQCSRLWLLCQCKVRPKADPQCTYSVSQK